MICFNCYNEEKFIYKLEKEDFKIKEDIINIDVTNIYCRNCGTKILNFGLDRENLKRAKEIYDKKHKKSDSDFLQRRLVNE